MQEDKIKDFLNQHKETISGDGFNARLFNTLNYLPQPKPQRNKTPLIVAISSCIGFLLFVLLGGYGVLINGLSTIGQVFVDVHALTPEIVTACIMLALTFVALVRFAARSYNR